MSFRVNSRSGEPCIRGHQRKGTEVCFADGSVRFVAEDHHPGLVKSLLTANGGEDVSED